jgi:hypothetical protein
MSLYHILTRRRNKFGGRAPSNLPVAKMYIHAGQSNLGRTTYYDFSAPQAAIYRDVSYPYVKIYNPYITTSALQQMQPCVNTQIDGDVLQWGSELSFFKSFSADTETRYLLKYGVGNTDLQNQWSSTIPGTLYTNLINYFDTFFDLIVADGKQPVFEVFDWNQGENDAIILASANNYQTNLQNLIDNFLIHAQNKFNAAGFTYTRPKIIIVRINGALDPSEVYRTTVRTAEVNFCGILGNTANWINTDGYSLKNDNVHYDASGQIQLGIDKYNLLQTF